MPTTDTNQPRSAQAATLRELLEASASSRGDAVFLVDPQTQDTWNYAELLVRARNCAGRMATLGARPGDRIALLAENGPDAVEVLLGALYGGFVPVPVQPMSGPRALSHVLAHSGAKLIFAGFGFKEPLGEIDHDARVIELASAGTDSSSPADDPHSPPPESNGLLIYTSGSTGRPKGVLFDHRGLLACARNTVLAHEIGPADRFLCTLPLYHMNSIDKLLGVVQSGGSIVLPARFELASYWRWAEEFQCTWLAIVPTLVVQLLRWSEPDADLRRVRYARCSSAPLGDADHRAFEERFGIPLLQGMGTTETGSLFLNPIPPGSRRIGSLGLPHGYETRVIGPDGRSVEDGDIGLLEVRGEARMRGYFRDPAATRDAIDSDGWLRTGDQVYRDSDGFFFAAGREKELIIKAGTNIAPREIDEILELHPAVAEAAAVGVPDPHFGEDIVAYVVRRGGRKCGESELIAHCAQHLGELKKPSAIRFADELPHGPSGKLQRLRLRDIEAARAKRTSLAGPDPGQGFVAPSSEVERALCELWAEMLECERVGVHDNFFELGGFSLIAFRLLVEIRKRLETEVPAAIFFDRPTVCEQAAFIEDRRRSGEGEVGRPEPLVAVRDDCRAPPLFCIFGPSRYLRLAELLGENQPTYGLFVEREFDVMLQDATGASRVSFPTVEELAAKYIEQVRWIQPEGPLHLAGLSFGGRIALEMAHQLNASGEEVALVAAFDTFMPGATRRSPIGWFAHHVAKLFREGPRPLLGALAIKRRHRRKQRNIAAGSAPRATDAGDAMSRSAELRRRARELHDPKPYAGRVVLFRAQQKIEYPPYYKIDPLLGWGRLATCEFRVHDITGNHLGIMRDPGVVRLAETLRGYLPGDGNS